MRLRVLFHGHCFDGVASAAVFTRFYREMRPGAEVTYTPLLHHDGALFTDGMFDGEENAVVDFKYSPAPKLTWWFPEASYAVAVTRTPLRTKISVGSNPWSPRPRAHNIATLCERYGGGGHAVVGAISLGPSEIESARAAAREIVGELSHV